MPAALLVSAGVEAPAQSTARGRIEDARDAYANDELDRAVALYEAVAATPGGATERVEALESLAAIARTQGRFEDAIDWAERTRGAARESGDALAEGEALHTRGLAAYSLGRREEAIANVRESLEIHKRAGHTHQEVIRLTNLGGLSQLAGRYFDAQEYYETALARLDELVAKPWAAQRRAVAVANLASLYQRLGRYDRALDLYRASESAGQLAFGDRAQLLANMGVLYRRLGDPYKAVETYAEAEALAVRVGDVARSMSVGVNRGIALALDLDRLEEAERVFQAVLARAEARDAKREGLHAWLYLAETRRRLGRLDEAEANYAAALEQADELGLAEERWKALFGLGRIAEARGEPAESEAFYRRSVEGVESLRSRLESGSLERGFLAGRTDPYAALIGVLLRSPQADPACKRGNVCVELVRWIGAQRQPSSLDVEDSSELQSLREELAAAWRERLEAAADERGDLDLRIERLESAYERAAQRGPAHTGASLAELQRSLDSDTVVLILWAGRESLLRMWITSRWARYEASAYSEDERHALHSFGEAVAHPGGDWTEPAKEAGRILLGEGAPPAETLLVFADGSLGDLPLETVIPPDAAEPLIHSVPIAHLETLEVPRRSRPAPSWPWSRTFAAFAYSQPEPDSGLTALASASDEARRIEARLPGDGDAFVEARATRARLTQELARPPAVLHLAAHALLDEERPELSRLLLAPADASSDRPEPVLLAEIERLPLTGVRLAVLSACDTARGRRVSGDGIRSLGRAFLDAGAESVVAGLWRIPDRETAVLMDQFYYWIGKGEDRARALSRAKADLARTSLHPYYWAGFRLTTRASGPAVRPLPWAQALAGLAVMLALIAMARRKISRPSTKSTASSSPNHPAATRSRVNRSEGSAKRSS